MISTLYQFLHKMYSFANVSKLSGELLYGPKWPHDYAHFGSMKGITA